MISVLHIAIVTTSIKVNELAVVFDFACSFGVAFLFFILPSLFMLLTLHKFPKGQLLCENAEGKLLKILAYLVMVIGSLVFGCTAVVTFVDLN